MALHHRWDIGQPLAGRRQVEATIGVLFCAVENGHLGWRPDLDDLGMIDRPSRTAILFDFLMSNRAGVPGHTFWLRLYAFCWGIHDRVAMPAYQVIMWTNFFAVRRAVREVLAADVERALLVHAPTEAMADDCRGRLREGFAWVSEIGILGHVVLMRDYFVAQPSFFRDFVRYLVRG